MKYPLYVIASATYLLLYLADNGIGCVTNNDTEAKNIKTDCGSACKNEMKNKTTVIKGRSKRMADFEYSDDDSEDDKDEIDPRYSSENSRGYRGRLGGSRRFSAYTAPGRGRGYGFGYGEGFVSGRGIALGEGIGYGDGIRPRSGIARGVYVKEGTGYGEGYGIGYGDLSGRRFSSSGGYFKGADGEDSVVGGRRYGYSGPTYRQRVYATRRRNPDYDTEDGTDTFLGGIDNRRSGPANGRGIYVEEGAVKGRGIAVSGVDDSNSDGRYGDGNVKINNGQNYGRDTVNYRRNRYGTRYAEESGYKSGKDAVLGEGYASGRGGDAYSRGISVKEGTISGRGIGIANVDDIRPDSSHVDADLVQGYDNRRVYGNAHDRTSSRDSSVKEETKVGSGIGIADVDRTISTSRNGDGKVKTINGGIPGTINRNNDGNRGDSHYSDKSGSNHGKDVALEQGYGNRRRSGTENTRDIPVHEGTNIGRGVGIKDVDATSSDSRNGDEKVNTRNVGSGGSPNTNNDGTRRDSRYGEESGTKSGSDVSLGEAHDSRRGYGSAYSRGISVKQGTITGRGIAFADVHGIGD